MHTENHLKSVVLQRPDEAEHRDPVAEAIHAWPADRPLAILSAGRLDGASDESRADPSSPSPSVAPRWTILCAPSAKSEITHPDDLDRLLAPKSPPGRAATESDAPPFTAGRLVLLTYELGHALETAAGAISPPPPLGIVADIATAHAYDHATGRWSSPPPSTNPTTPAYHLGPLTSDMGSAPYRDAVRTALGYIRAGDVYQVNLAHRLSASFEGSPRALAAHLYASAAPAHGVYAELPDRSTNLTGHPSAIISASPELFVSFDPATRRVRTQPMKGTRPITGDPAELRVAEKDRAELDMITDLMRNDLGRVCAFGSMRVDAARTIEAHGSSVWQATSTVSGILREGLTPADLVRATFPPGSVTGAPKVRAMQIIHELEPVPRGFYCGALGWLDDSGAMSLNVAIRTATITLDAASEAG
jgi:para-aminobenzoate synthetase component 1